MDISSVDALLTTVFEGYSQVYTAVEDTLEKCITKIVKLETAFYGTTKSGKPLNANHEIRKYLSLFKELAVRSEVNRINSVTNAERICYLLSTDIEEEQEVSEDIETLKGYLSKVENVIPSKFYDLISNLKTVYEALDKYCVSFYDTSHDPELPTSRDYEISRQHLGHDLLHWVDNITLLGKQLRSSGIDVSTLSPYGQGLAGMFDCSQYAILLAFPEACENIRMAVENIKDWIREDTTYASFIATDIQTLKRAREKLTKELLVHQDEYHQLRHRMRKTLLDKDRTTQELQTLREKANVLQGKEDSLSSDEHATALALEVKQVQKCELEKKLKQATIAGEDSNPADEAHLATLNSQILSLTLDLRELRKDLSSTSRQLNVAKNKSKHATAQGEDIGKMSERCTELSSKRRLIEMQIDKLDNQIAVAKQIHLFKTSSDSLSKILKGIPTRGKQSITSGHNLRQGDLETAFELVSDIIDMNWVPLYRALPFDPPRGEETLCNDIYDLRFGTARSRPREQALNALNRWKRFHNQCTLNNLKDALIEINKEDLWLRIERILFPPVKKKTVKEKKDDHIKSVVTPRLIPYYQQVERWEILKSKFERLEKEEMKLIEQENVDDRLQALHNEDLDAIANI